MIRIQFPSDYELQTAMLYIFINYATFVHHFILTEHSEVDIICVSFLTDKKIEPSEISGIIPLFFP